MHQLRQQNTARVGVDPDDEDSHSRHECDEGEKKGQPIHAVWGSASQVINHRCMPQSPQHPQQDAGGQCALLQLHPRERKPIQPISSKNPDTSPNKMPSRKTCGLKIRNTTYLKLNNTTRL